MLLNRLPILISLLAILTACSGNKAVEDLLKPDPKLERTPPPSQKAKLPSDFPEAIPRYPEAEFLTTKREETGEVETTWQSTATGKEIVSYYQDTLPARKWQLEKLDNSKFALAARKDNLELKLFFPLSAPGTFALQYHLKAQNPPDISEPTITRPPIDSERIPEIYRSYLEDLVGLGILSNTFDFKPNEAISRREFARWLVTANNRIFADIPSKQIRLAVPSSTSVFKDVNTTDPDFPQIQGLAEAGLIPSPLTVGTSSLLFRPDAPLTREKLILWKVPLDTRQGLPPADIETIKQTWGFIDSNKIDPKVLSSFYADFQNGERAIVRRVFGYITLLQPKKPVTRAEAAAALWYFGNLAEGRSAAEVLQLQN